MVNTFVALDIETTGLSTQKDRIIEIGALKVVDGKVTDQFSELVNPNIPLTERIVLLTGIEDTMLVNAREEAEVLLDFYEFVKTDILLGHNILFDYAFIKTGMARLKLDFQRQGLDTLQLARRFHMELPSRKLSDMCNYYGIENLKNHRATADAEATKKLYFKLAEKFYCEEEKAFEPFQLQYKIKKQDFMTNHQKNYLLDLMKYHKIEWKSIMNTFQKPLEELSRGEASQLIDAIILKNGRINVSHSSMNTK